MPPAPLPPRFFAAAPVLLVLAGLAGPAVAQIRSIEEQRGGAWLYRAGQARERTACILETERPDGTVGGQVRLAILNQPFEFHLSLRDRRWRIPPGTTGLVRLEVEGYGTAPYHSTQRARQGGPDRIMVDLADNPQGAARILDALRHGRRLVATLPDGQAIAAPLGGTVALVGRLLDCFQRRIVPRQQQRQRSAMPFGGLSVTRDGGGSSAPSAAPPPQPAARDPLGPSVPTAR
jgi:hypothetical protein